jgi:glycolate oxidase iron-sulfur subunit
LAAQAAALNQVRKNIDTWWPALEKGAEAIVITASGCGVFVKEYGHLLRHDPNYADKAARVSELARDIGEILAKEDLAPLLPTATAKSPTKVALHIPCTLQHGQKLVGLVESLLKRFGFELTYVPDAHLCCGSAGTYSILHRAMAQQLLTNKLTALQSGNPQLIVTANIGCQMHLQSQANVPVKHWIELIMDNG